MPRTIHLAITSNGRRPAHQAVFVPTGDAGAVGKVIHVTGNAATGFFLEIKRNYDLEATARKYLLIPLAQIDERFVRDTVGNGEPGVDTTARDRLESAAIVAVPPGRSANPFDSSSPNCQNWMLSYVQKLVDEGFINGSAMSVVENAPKIL